jgi:hypothetical protein
MDGEPARAELTKQDNDALFAPDERADSVKDSVRSVTRP